MSITQIRIATAAALGAATIALVAAPMAAAAPGPLPKICVVAGETVACPAPTEVSNFPGAVRLYPYGALPVPMIGHR